MRRSMAAEAVAREPSQEERREERWVWEGGVKESWVVARRRERVVRLERMAALPCEALSLIMPISSFSFVIVAR